MSQLLKFTELLGPKRITVKFIFHNENCYKFVAHLMSTVCHQRSVLNNVCHKTICNVTYTKKVMYNIK
jgi:hypothetical protein